MTEMNEKNGLPAGAKRKHSISVEDRARMTVDGVTEVVSFDDVSVLLVTTCGEMTVEGSDLKLSQLDTERGCVCVCGRIGGIYYGDDLPKKRRRRMFASE